MDEILQEFVTSRDVAMRVDAEQAIIRGVKLLGYQSRNGRRYLPAALERAVALYEGAKVNVNHPKGNPLAARDYQDRVGAIRNVRVSDQGLFGDFHFNPKHALAEQLLWDATHAPENVGFSHNVEARTSRQGDQVVVEAILKVQSVDLVADPATTRGLYESAELPGAWADLTLEQIRRQRPDLIEAVEAESATRLAVVHAELDRLTACEAVRQQRAVVTRLLREFKLPEPDPGDAARPQIVSELFVETLMAADDERTMRALVQERAGAIAAARRADRGMAGLARPVSREQHAADPSANQVTDGRSFARAIS